MEPMFLPPMPGDDLQILPQLHLVNSLSEGLTLAQRIGTTEEFTEPPSNLFILKIRSLVIVQTIVYFLTRKSWSGTDP